MMQYTGMMLLEEMASIFLTPYLLIFVVPEVMIQYFIMKAFVVPLMLVFKLRICYYCSEWMIFCSLLPISQWMLKVLVMFAG